ncbi:MAG: hypothetical protein IT336_00695 [Thermomicrobiales bacterium]|nr:hypothetical protein [Thermomicrobiales bacterium]
MTEHRTDAEVRTTKDSVRPKSPPAPGGSVSPQHPGMTPDRSTIPGKFSTSVPRAASKRRPLTQYATAEEVMRVYKRLPEDQMAPKDFEQATASYEELRKAFPREMPPVRPAQPAIAAGETPEAISSGGEF